MNPTSIPPITEDDIADYLANTPEFFERHAQMLATVQLTSPHGHRAVSLQERQAEMLRDKIKALEHRIMEMVRYGNENVVIADRLGPRDLLDELPPHVEVIDAAKIPYGRFMAQEAINQALIEHAKAGKSVVRLKGGDPFVFGRGMEEAQALAAEGIPCTVVPGVSSALSVPALAGIPVSNRGMTHEVTIVSGHLPPGHPGSLIDWEALARMRGTLVVLMGVKNSPAIADSLMAGGREGVDRAIAILTDEVERTMKLLQVQSLQELGPQHVTQLSRLTPLAADSRGRRAARP